MLIDEFNEAFDSDLHMSDVDTMAGYLITALGMIPDEGESYRLMSIILRWFLKKWKVLESLNPCHFHDPEETEAEPEEERRYFRKEFEDDEPRR